MSLDNVYYWDKDSWKKITAEKFVEVNPDVKKSAKDKYFWCEMCGQYVGLANGDVNKPHFRHSSAESKKDCEYRAKSFVKNDWIKSIQPSYDLPLKICVEQNDFYFKIGLTRLPYQIFEKVKRCCVKIQSSEKFLNRYDLSDYLIEGATTWLDVGSSPKEFYSLILEPKISEVDFYWSKKLDGVNPLGTLFDVSTGRKILTDADIKVNSKYYLLTTNQYISSFKSVAVEPLICKEIFSNKWVLYTVEATELSEGAAKFFLNYHYRLTVKPILTSPIYPVYTQDDDAIYCDAEKIFVYFSGNAKIKFFPQVGNSILFEEKNSKLIEVACNERQKMIATGRSQILQYLYLWKNFPTYERKLPKVEVKDFNDKIVESGTYNILPKNSTLQIYNEFDCQVVVNKNNVILNKFFVKDGRIFNIDEIDFGMEIRIFQGLDCIWWIKYEHKEKGILKSDEELFLKLECGKGKKIKFPHTWGIFFDRLKDYPKVKGWLYRSIRAGFVNEESYFIFREFILEEM